MHDPHPPPLASQLASLFHDNTVPLAFLTFAAIVIATVPLHRRRRGQSPVPIPEAPAAQLDEPARPKRPKERRRRTKEPKGAALQKLLTAAHPALPVSPVPTLEPQPEPADDPAEETPRAEPDVPVPRADAHGRCSLCGRGPEPLGASDNAAEAALEFPLNAPESVPSAPESIADSAPESIAESLTDASSPAPSSPTTSASLSTNPTSLPTPLSLAKPTALPELFRTQPSPPASPSTFSPPPPFDLGPDEPVFPTLDALPPPASLRAALDRARRDAALAAKECDVLKWRWAEDAAAWRHREAELQGHIHRLSAQLAYSNQAAYFAPMRAGSPYWQVPQVPSPGPRTPDAAGLAEAILKRPDGWVALGDQ